MTSPEECSRVAARCNELATEVEALMTASAGRLAQMAFEVKRLRAVLRRAEEQTFTTWRAYAQLPRVDATTKE